MIVNEIVNYGEIRYREEERKIFIRVKEIKYVAEIPGGNGAKSFIKMYDDSYFYLKNDFEELMVLMKEEENS